MSKGKFGEIMQAAAPGMIGTVLGMAMQGANDRRQLRQQQKLQELEMQGSKEMTKFNMEQQLAMWNATGYEAQKKQMKAAGLNPAMMYGMSGGGGQSMGIANGSVSGGNAPVGGGEVQGMVGMGLQMGMMEAQKKVLESQANLNNVEAANKDEGGVVRNNIAADTENKQVQKVMGEVQTKIMELDLDMAKDSYKARSARIEIETNKALQELNILKNDAVVSENTWGDKIAIVGAELVGLQLRNELTKAQENKTWSDIKVNNATIQNWLVQQAQGWTKLSQDERNVKVNELLAEFNTSLSREALGAVGGLVTTIVSRGMVGKVKNVK